MFRELWNKILNSSVGTTFTRRFPIITAFIRTRLRTDKFYGLPLTILISVFVLNSFLLTKIGHKVLNSSTVTEIDQNIMHYLYENRSIPIARTLFVYTYLGHPIIIIFASLLICITFLFKRNFLLVASLLVSVIGSRITISIGKNLYHLSRPEEFSWYKENSFTFPSGHATVAVSFYGLLAYYLILQFPHFKTKILIFALWLIVALLLGFSRLYLGVHYLSDVIGGFLLGGMWLILSISFLEWKKYKFK